MVRTILLILLLAALLPAVPTASAQSTEPESIVLVHLDKAIDDSTVALFERAKDRAIEKKAKYLIIEIDSPGDTYLAMTELGRVLDDPDIRPVAYVRGSALSAAAYVALCCPRIYTGPLSGIGSATPIFVLPGIGLVPGNQIDEDIMEKMMSDARQKFKSRGGLHPREGIDALAAAMVDPRVEVLLVEYKGEVRPMSREEFSDKEKNREDVRFVKTIDPPDRLLNLTADEAFEYGLSDGIVVDRTELLQALGIPDARIEELRVSWSETFFATIGSYSWILWGLALILLFVEFHTPGFGVPGVLGLALIALLLFRNSMIGLAEIPEILLVVLGIVLLAIEVFVIPGFGITGILGIVSIGLGVVLSCLPFFTPSNPLESDLLNDTLRNFLLTLLIAPVAAYGLFHSVLKRLPFYRALTLEGASTQETLASAVSLGPSPEFARVRVGDRGLATSVLRPAGKVEIDGQVYDASAGGDFIEIGVAVEVVSIAPNFVVVRRSVGTA